MQSKAFIPPLSHEQCQLFARDGFLVVDSLLDDADLEPLEAEYLALLHHLTPANTSRTKTTFADGYERYIADRPDLHCRFNISLPLNNGRIDPATFHMHHGPAVFHLLRHPKILDCVECLIGPEICSSPVQQMRIKPPLHRVNEAVKDHSNVGPTTWHQDIVALLPEADPTEQLTVWLAITDATEENGCLMAIPESHRHGPQPHCINSSLASEPHIPSALVVEDKAKTLPVKRGGAIFFHKMNVHRSLPNRSQTLRWSMDLRYHPIGQASGRPAFPGFVARSRAHPERECRDPEAWAATWDLARETIISGRYIGRLFEDRRWHDKTVC